MSDTAPSDTVAAESRLDLVAEWIATFDVLSPPLSARRIGHGQSNLTYRLTDTDGRQWVLRRPPRGHVLQSAHDIGREHRIIAALQGSEVPVPRVFGMWTVDGVPNLLMEYVDGLVIEDPASAQSLTTAARRSVGASMARTLAAVHAVELADVQLLDLASHKPYAPRQLSRWARQLDASRTRALPDLDRLTDLLTRRLPEPNGLCLVHGDLHTRNIICDPATGNVRAALDWELSTLGDPLADLGTLLAYWPHNGETDCADVFAPSTLPGFAAREEIIATYADTTGRDVSALGFWHVLGLWKLAVIVEGIRKRISDEPANAAPSGAPPAAYTEDLLRRAWALVGEYGL